MFRIKLYVGEHKGKRMYILLGELYTSIKSAQVEVDKMMKEWGYTESQLMVVPFITGI